MERRTIIILTLLLLALHAKASPVSVEQARQKAAAFFQRQQAAGARHRAPAAQQLRLAAQGRDATYYIYNAPADGDGYVVVSGDDATEPILGFSDTGTINADSMPCGLRALLYGYEGQIRLIRDKGLTYSQTRKKNLPKRSYMIEGVKARFDQHAPYWNDCPNEGFLGLGKNTLTGCVATAMAQLMYYHQKPEQITRDIPGYTTDTHDFDIDGFAANTAIDWTNIKRTYCDSYNDEEAKAVAQLMKMAGTAVHMDYDSGFSGSYTWSVPWALKLYFGYDTSAEYRMMSQYPSEWEDMLRDELENRGPVVYSGSDGNEGHCFMLEGYDEQGYFYVNYGWNTHDHEEQNGNGWFQLQVAEGLDKKDLIKYNISQDAVFNVKPRNVITNIDIPLHLSNANVPSAVGTGNYFQRDAETGRFEDVAISMELYSPLPFTAQFDAGVAFSKDGNETAPLQVQNYATDEMFEFKASKQAPTKTVVLQPYAYALDDGIYKILGMSRESGKEAWLVNDNAEVWANWAFVCNDRMAVMTPGAVNTDLRVTSFEQTSPERLRVGQESTFSITVANYGVSPERYIGCVVVVLSYTDREGNKQNKVLAIDEASCAGNESVTITFPFTPTQTGEQTISVLNKHLQAIFSSPVTPIAADHSLDLLEVIALDVDNQNADGSIDGTYLKGSLTLHNLDVVPKYEQIYVSLEDALTGVIMKTKPVQVNIAPDDTVAYGFMFTNLVVGQTYRIIARYHSGVTMFKSVPMLCKDEDTGETFDGNDQLTYYEYWFDDDLAHRQHVALGSSRAVVRDGIDTDHLCDGMHRLHFRVHRADGKFSSVFTTPFLKLAKEKEGRMDYWLDNDIDNRQSVAVADTEEEQELQLDLSDNQRFALGYHQLNMQVATAGSALATVNSQPVLKLASGRGTMLEYWFDDSIAARQKFEGRLASSGDACLFVNDIDMTGLPAGLHRLNVRATSTNGATSSSVLSCHVMKLASSKASTIEYWFDDDLAHIKQLQGVADTTDYVFDGQIDMSGLSLGLHRISLRPAGTDGSNRGSVVSCNVFKLAATEITALEYWFDGDVAHSRTLSGSTAPTAAEGCLFAGDLDLTDITPGHHRLSYRAIGSDGQATTAALPLSW